MTSLNSSLNEVKQEVKVFGGLRTLLKLLTGVFQFVSIVEKNVIRLVDTDVLRSKGDSRIILNGLLQNVFEVLRVDLKTDLGYTLTTVIATEVPHNAKSKLAPPIDLLWNLVLRGFGIARLALVRDFLVDVLQLSTHGALLDRFEFLGFFFVELWVVDDVA